DCGLVFLHVFPYSARPGTPAARMPAVPKAVRKERAARLRARGAVALRRWLAGQTGRDIAVLIEGEGKGRSEHYAAVRFDGSAFAGGCPAGGIVPMRVTGAAEDTLLAGPAQRLPA
ncbi:MAG: tRNA (N(6)-L-threonylcarbamoyladenosine(37)-C(2))-methylthiotransferase MtaB, partial [Rhodospirillaceae bacterium]|nr:tRNA (N(6)-L-threonylcarbamoyladenosine(37)-C(2))-methylthiotransferase MtaB [Rhodospirillaceae bacterium]